MARNARNHEYCRHRQYRVLGVKCITIVPDLKIVGYNPRKRPEMLEYTSFADTARVVYRGHRAMKSSREPKIVSYYPRKRPEMLKINSFADVARVVYRGSQGIKMLPRPENNGL